LSLRAAGTTVVAAGGKNMKPVCLVIGAGAGIGGTVAKRFAREGYHASLCRRSDADGLQNIVLEIEQEGGTASGSLLNAIEENSIEDLVADIEANIGPIDVAVYNLGAQIGDRPLKDTSHKAFEMGWRMGTFGLFRLASAVCPHMEERGTGTIIVTSATAAVRGNGGQHSHAAAMGGRRMLCQTLNAEFSPRGIHVAHVIIDGAVDAPDTLGKMLGPERFQELRKTRGMEHDGLMLPTAIADTYYHLATQHRSAWTHEIDMRSFSDRPWWNH
jgi:NAD(P)-dependent dehydrogenase (short-subunit alcohol dehydrogenase family)